MPNHVVTEIRFRNLDNKQKRNVKGAVFNFEGHVDFNLLLPLPLNLWRWDEGRKEKETFGSGLDWCVANWGTKWNAYESRMSEEGDDFLITFQTAWHTPHKWLVALFSAVDLDFELITMSEGETCCWHEKYFSVTDTESYKNKRWERNPGNEAQTNKTYELLWGKTKKEYEEDKQK